MLASFEESSAIFFNNSSVVQPNWFLMLCVFTGVNLIKVTVIGNNTDDTSDFLDSVLIDLPKYFNVTYLVEVLPLDNEHPVYSDREQFSNEGEFFDLRPIQKKKSKKIHRVNNGSDPDFLRDTVGNMFGVIVITSDLSSLDKYLIGTARNPFRNPNGFYIICILESLDKTNTWTVKVLDSVLERLWRYYGILKVVVTFGGSKSVSLLYFYIMSFTISFIFCRNSSISIRLLETTLLVIKLNFLTGE